MATYTGSTTVSAGTALAILLGSQISNAGPTMKSGPFKVEVTVDFTQYFGTAGSAAAATTGAASASVISLVNIPVGMSVTQVQAEVLTVTTGSGTLSVGDTKTGATAYISGQAPTSKAYLTVSTTNWNSLYTTADILFATVNTATISDAKVRFVFVMVNLSKDQPAGPGGDESWTA